MPQMAQLCKTADELLAVGRYREAEQALRLALCEDYQQAAPYRLLSRAASKQSRHREAVALARHAVCLHPSDVENPFTLGVVLMAGKKDAQAVQAYRAALEIVPDLPEAHLNLGNVLKNLERYEEAETHYQKALALRPDMAEAYLNLGAILRVQKQFKASEQAILRARDLAPNLPGLWGNLGNVLSEQGRFDEACAAYRQQLARTPGDADMWVAYGANLLAARRDAEAITAYDRAVAAEPSRLVLRFERSVALLQLGMFERGWADYEFRWHTDSLRKERPTLPGAEWQGEDLDGKTLFVFGEQGYGDNLQFVRYLPMLTALGAKVIFCTEETLKRVVHPLPDGVAWYDCRDALPTYDYHVALLSLPFHFKTRIDTIPAAVPYLLVDAEKKAGWARRIRQLAKPGCLKVGLVWTGRPTHGNDAERSMQPEMLEPVLSVPGIQFFSVQKAPREGHLDRLRQFTDVVDLSVELDDFADTAAVLENLDLLISADTSVAHLAGALARPVWVFVTQQPDWRWMNDRTDSPWYPTMHLYRQSGRADWSWAVADMRRDLEWMQGKVV